MTNINAISGVQNNLSTSETQGTAPNSSKININFTGYGSDNLDAYYAKETLRNDGEKFLKNMKKNIKLNDSWYHIFFGNDHIIFNPKNVNITYGALRKQLGILPGRLSKTNNSHFKDSDKIKTPVEINLKDMGWLKETGLSEDEEAANRALRRNGASTAGYYRAYDDDQVINWLK